MLINFCVALFLIVYLDQTNPNLIEVGKTQGYAYENSIYVENAVDHSKQQNKFYIKGDLEVSSIQNDGTKHLIKFELKSQKCNFQIGDDKKSILEYSCDLKPFNVLFLNNLPCGIYSEESAKESSRFNLQKGIANLFYLNRQSKSTQEPSASGECNVVYETILSHRFKKYLTNCTGWMLKSHHRKEKVLDANVNSFYEVEYEFSNSGELDSISAIEDHYITMGMAEKLGTSVKSVTTLRHTTTKQVDVNSLNLGINEEIDGLTCNSLLTKSNLRMNRPKAPRLSEMIKKFQNDLSQDDAIGKDYSDIFIKILSVARTASASEFAEVIELKENDALKLQLANLFGAVQSTAAYEAFVSSFDRNEEINFPVWEKYLQSLATGARPNREIIKNLLMLIKENSVQNHKLRETIILTICSMSRKFYASKAKDDLYDDVKSHILENLGMCSTDDCKSMFTRCLNNLRDTSTIYLLLQMALTENPAISVAAMKALQSYDQPDFNPQHRIMLRKVLFQSIQRTDSSSRTLALDLLLHPEISEKELIELFELLSKQEEPYEIKTYFLQKVMMLQQTSRQFKTLIKGIPSISKIFSNYNTLSQKGLSTVLQRPYISSEIFNGTLQTNQEILGGILKRGLVSINLWGDDEEAKIFELGLHTSGLSSIVGGDNNQALNEDSTNDELVMAGMDITVMGSQMRPLILFDGYGELMGHIWSNTAAEPISAFQSTILVHDTEQFINLQNGLVVQMLMLGANSIDLFGQAQFSLWNRNAHTEIQKSSGWTLQKKITLNVFDAALEQELLVNAQPNLQLTADIDFYSDMKLCLQLERSETSVKLELRNSLYIGNKTHKKKTSGFRYNIPGTSIALNRKNNEMCYSIFKHTL